MTGATWVERMWSRIIFIHQWFIVFLVHALTSQHIFTHKLLLHIHAQVTSSNICYFWTKLLHVFKCCYICASIYYFFTRYSFIILLLIAISHISSNILFLYICNFFTYLIVFHVSYFYIYITFPLFLWYLDVLL